MKKLLIIFCLLVSGCASTEYRNVVKSRDTQLDFDQDAFTCERQAKVYIQQGKSSTGLDELLFEKKCMKALGWREQAKKK